MEPALLILDLDETLVHCSRGPLGSAPHFEVSGYVGYRRPGLLAFLDAMSAIYRLAIWSSAGDRYVAEVVEAAIGAAVGFDFVWGSSRGTMRRDINLDEWFYAKDLAKLKRTMRTRSSRSRDDDPRKVARSYGNAIYVDEFEGDEDDEELPRLARYLTSIKDVPNYRAVEKRYWRQRADVGTKAT